MLRSSDVLIALLFAISFLAVSNAQPAVDASGVWIATDVPYAPWTVQLKQQGDALTGTMEQNGGLTGTVHIYEGSIHGSAISFKAKSPDGAREITFTGTIDGDAITLNRSTKIITDASQGGNGLFGTRAAPQFVVRRGTAGTLSGRIGTMELLRYNGFRVDISFLSSGTSLPAGLDRESILNGFRHQFDLLDAALRSADLKAFARSVPFVLSPRGQAAPDQARYGSLEKRIDLLCLVYSPEKPVFLHELMHAYHDQKVKDGMRNPEILGLYEQAKASGKFPAKAYMLSNAREYFAMMGSVYLYGSAARDPFTRAAIKEKQPDCYRWMEKEFGPR